MTPTWISPFAAVWRVHYPDGAIPFKQLAQALKPLVDAYPTDRIAGELHGYLRETPPQFLNLRKFSATFGIWNRKPPTKPYSQSVDEMDRNAGIMP